MRPFDDEGNYIYDTNVQHRQGDDIVPDFNIFEERANTSNENTFTSLMSIFDAEFKWNEHFKVTSQFGLQWDENMIEKYAGQDSYAMRREKEQHQYNGTTVLPEGGSNKITENHSSQWTWKATAE